MLTPTISGVITQPLKALTATTDDTVTAQEMVDGIWGGILYGATAKHFRDLAVVRKQLGERGVEQFKAGLVAGII
jgi:hypothetical protein